VKAVVKSPACVVGVIGNVIARTDDKLTSHVGFVIYKVIWQIKKKSISELEIARCSRSVRCGVNKRLFTSGKSHLIIRR
jgi:hypothetical protein